MDLIRHQKFKICENLILNKNLDMVYGNRLVNQEKNSMPILHKYLGTPVLSFFIRVFLKIILKIAILV